MSHAHYLKQIRLDLYRQQFYLSREKCPKKRALIELEINELTGILQAACYV